MDERHEPGGVCKAAQQRDAVAETELLVGVHEWQFQRVHFSTV
jgi:hypothetical protein